MSRAFPGFFPGFSLFCRGRIGPLSQLCYNTIKPAAAAGASSLLCARASGNRWPSAEGEGGRLRRPLPWPGCARPSRKRGRSAPRTPRGTLSMEKEFPESQPREGPWQSPPTAYLPVRGTSSARGCSGRPRPFGSDARQCSALAERTCWSFYPGMASRNLPTAKMQRRKQQSPRPPSRIKIPSRGTNIDYRCASSVGPARERLVRCGFPPFPGSSGENKKGLRFRNPGTCACTVLRRILMIPRG